MNSLKTADFLIQKPEIFKRTSLGKPHSNQLSNELTSGVIPNNAKKPKKKKGGELGKPTPPVNSRSGNSILYFDHLSNLNRLEFYNRHASLTDVSTEATLLNKLVLMYHNQQRRASNFRKLQALNVCFKKLSKANPKDFIQHIVNSFYSNKQTKKIEYDCVPPRSFMQTCALRVLEIIKLVIKTEDLCKQVYVMFLDQAQQTFFMNLSLVVCGISSRLNALLMVFKKEMIGLYTLLKDWINNLPFDRNAKLKEAQINNSNSLLDPLSLESNLTSQMQETHTLVYSQNNENSVNGKSDSMPLELRVASGFELNKSRSGDKIKYRNLAQLEYSASSIEEINAPNTLNSAYDSLGMDEDLGYPL